MILIKVLHDRELTSTEKVVFCEINIQNKMKYHCNMTNSELARLLGVSQKTISRSLTRLYKRNYLTIFNQGNTRIVRVNEN